MEAMVRGKDKTTQDKLLMAAAVYMQGGKYDDVSMDGGGEA